jgi:hypothetical protein
MQSSFNSSQFVESCPLVNVQCSLRKCKCYVCYFLPRTGTNIKMTRIISVRVIVVKSFLMFLIDNCQYNESCGQLGHFSDQKPTAVYTAIHRRVKVSQQSETVFLDF